MKKNYDFIVIGSGGGLKFSMTAAAQRKRVALIESTKTGGTCLNRGCIPSKLMIYPADVLHLFHRSHRLNIQDCQSQTIRFADLMERVTRSTDEISTSLTQRLEEHEYIDYHHGTGRFIDNKTIEVNGETLSAPNILIATGSRPYIPSINGLAQTPFMTSDDALQNRILPKSMIIIGAGYIACELGHAYASFGCETHFIVRSDLLRHEDQQIRKLFKREFEKLHTIHRPYTPIQVNYNAEHKRFTVHIKHVGDNHIESIEAERLLIAAGVIPQTDNLQLECAGVKTNSAGYIDVDQHFKTSAEGIYAVGDCIGKYLFRHSVNREVEYLADYLLQHSEKPFTYGPIPHAVFTIPEIAGAGITEEQADAKGMDYVTGYTELAESNMGLARQLPYGFCKLIVERTSRSILGVHIIGEDASTLIQIPVTVMYNGGILDDLLNTVYIHPAYPEVIKDAARDALSKL